MFDQKSENLEEVFDDKKKILLDLNVCAGCQNCVSVCPHGIWEYEKETNQTHLNNTNLDQCFADMECVRVCPTGAIEIIQAPE